MWNKIINPENGSISYTITENLYVGNLFAQNIFNIESLDLALETNTLVLDGSTNSITMQATVRDSNGNQIEGVPVSFANATSYGTFAINDVCGLSPLESSIISNLAAGRVCEEIGVCPINIDSLKDIFSHHYNKDE